MSQFTEYPKAAEIEASAWINTAKPLSLAQMRGTVVVIHVFQMLCPGCVLHGIPQTQLIRQTFSEKQVKVLGLHSVFEHHSVMNIDALRAFSAEYRITFPIAIDAPSTSGHIPKTMQRYGLQGTPTLILIDKLGRLRLQHYGKIADMQVAKLISELVGEQQDELQLEPATTTLDSEKDTQCTDTGCQL